MINEQQSRLFTDPLEIIKRDKKKMKSEKKKWDKQLELVENQLAKIKDVLRKIDDALRFYYYEATDEIKEGHLFHYTALPCIIADMKFSYRHG